MDEKNPAGDGQPVEKKDQKENPEHKAPEGDDKNSGKGENLPPEEDESSKKLREANEEIARLTRDRDNYRQGLLSRKNKKKSSEYEDEDDEDDRFDMNSLDEIINKKVEEKLLDKKIDEAEKARQAIIDKTLKENAELKRALISKGEYNPPQGAGSNLDKPEVKQSFFSPEQEAALKARGLNPDDVMKNLPSKEAMSGAPSGAIPGATPAK